MSIRTLVSELVGRSRLANIAGHTFRGKRDLYKALGYQRELFVHDYRSRFMRNAIANRVVKAPALATWHGEAEVVEQEDPQKPTDFEKGYLDLHERLGLWTKFQAADVLAGIGRFSIILLGLPGDMLTPVCEIDPATNELVPAKPLSAGQITGLSDKSQPKFTGDSTWAQTNLPKLQGQATTLTGQPSDLKYVRPYSEEDCKVFKFDLDPISPRFGQPLYYNLTRTTMLSPESTNSNVIAKVVHWSRIIHIAEGRLDDLVYGEPRLQCVWNLIDDLEKVGGGGSEAFWIRANGGIQFDLDPTLEFEDEDNPNVPADPTKNQAIRKQIDEYEHELRKNLFTRGVKVNRLGSDVANFSAPVTSIISQISAGTGIPQRLLTGSERGELSSNQDKEEWNERIRARRVEFAGPGIVHQFVDRMIAIGVLPKPKEQYWVRWPSMKQMSEDEKISLALKYANINKTSGDTIVTRDEIRDIVLDLDPMTEEQELGEASMWALAKSAEHISVNEKRALTGLPDYNGSIDTDDYADIPAALLPKQAIRIIDPNVPANAPGGSGAEGDITNVTKAPVVAKGAATEKHPIHRAADRFRTAARARRDRELRRRQEGRRPRAAGSHREPERKPADEPALHGRDHIRRELEG